ncbi:hypothetical protein SAMN05216483_6701 [Streptomyces sp. 2131.1]|uniref:hypothetical protein n=1 Tax=Streptomyces sp. 2131.1 TaxID=1855346 RepID=UPI0008964F5C|nr:hypothetical protein [Streptomyces sp. 2131.1]SEE83255.1 hypothetical protein SAMN05216483_6701 [Streptomyces sp. 2131.1]
MTATRIYGTWTTKVNLYSTGPDADVDAVVDGGAPDWRAMLADTGALDRMKAEYRAAIDAALPGDVALCGEQFFGPAEPEAGEFDGYPVDEYGALDFAAMVEEIDLAAIVDRHDPDA